MIPCSLEDAVDDHLLGELLVVVEGPVDVAVEVPGDVEQLGLALHGVFVGAAGQVEREPEPAQVLEQRPGAVDEQLVRGDRARRRARRCGRRCARPADGGTRACTRAARSARRRARGSGRRAGSSGRSSACR